MNENVPCPGCELVYDLSQYSDGQRLRCGCGHIITVSEVSASVLSPERPSPEKSLPDAKSQTQYHIAHVFHCSNCGGALDKGASQCPFCAATIDLTTTRLTQYCNHCLSMSKEGALYCSECGRPFEQPDRSPERLNQTCPRCHINLRKRALGNHHPSECPMCLGLFIAVDDLNAMIDDQEKRLKIASPHGAPVQSELTHEPVAYLKCPICETTLNRVNYGRLSGVIIDYCRKHGYWLDNGELEKIAKWVASGGLEKKRQRELEEARNQRSRSSIQNIELSHKNTFRDDKTESMADILVELIGKLFK